MLDIEPPSNVTPVNSGGKPSMDCNHLRVTFSTSVAVGEVRQSIAC
jgi:hypothetical protein